VSLPGNPFPDAKARGEADGENDCCFEHLYPRPSICTRFLHTGSMHSKVCVSSRLKGVIGILIINRACVPHFRQAIGGMAFEDRGDCWFMTLRAGTGKLEYLQNDFLPSIAISRLALVSNSVPRAIRLLDWTCLHLSSLSKPISIGRYVF
jgi:hypothetical protein